MNSGVSGRVGEASAAFPDEMRSLNGRMLRHTLDDHRRRGPRRAAAVALLSATLGACLLAASAAGPASAGAVRFGDTHANADDRGDMLFETFSPDGSITLRHGGDDHAPQALPTPRDLHLAPGGLPTASGPVLVPMHENGRHDNRIDLVFVGDGYTASELPVFAQSAENAWQALMNYEPYKTYQNFFDASRIDIASPVSGISNDPTNGINKQTPLGMHFWCHGIDRLLCVDTKAANAYANLVPGINHVISIAHTATYGGAGGSITTLAGENQSSDGVIVHEMAHTIAGLGDEYDVPYDTAGGSDSDLANITSQSAAQMSANHTKWWRWIGKPSPDGGTVGAYDGANYYAHGFNRPSQNSEMRALGQPFNPPSTEALIESFYLSRYGQGSINPIDSVTPAPTRNGITAKNGVTLTANLIPLVGQNYTVYWGVNGTAVSGSLGKTSLDLTNAPLKAGQWNQVLVYVIDNNPAVADPDFRAKNMTKSAMWWVWGG